MADTPSEEKRRGLGRFFGFGRKKPSEAPDAAPETPEQDRALADTPPADGTPATGPANTGLQAPPPQPGPEPEPTPSPTPPEIPEPADPASPPPPPDRPGPEPTGPDIPAPERTPALPETDDAGVPSVKVPSETAHPALRDTGPPENEPESHPETQADAGSPRPEAPETEEPQPKKKGLFRRLREGLSRSTQSLSTGITDIFAKQKLSDDTLEELEDLLISCDLGVETASEVTAELAEGRYDKMISPSDVRGLLAGIIAEKLAPYAVPLEIDADKKPFVILVAGVNGTGKTTTIGKLAHKLTREGRSVLLAAGDTFRAAAIEQLKVWGTRTNSPVIARDIGADAAGLAFDAVKQARGEDRDVVLIDTAGRLQNKAALMDELAKILRVLKKQDPETPHAVLLVLDATTGQNAVSQVEIFQKVANVTGLIMTKLDGTARGGILVPVARKYGLPVHAIGVGEETEDLQAFDAESYARALTGADDQEEAG